MFSKVLLTVGTLGVLLGIVTTEAAAEPGTGNDPSWLAEVVGWAGTGFFLFGRFTGLAMAG